MFRKINSPHEKSVYELSPFSMGGKITKEMQME